mmetsp:Transcript_24676/g.52269  ORF Transcript_24676/g.52269 Transcript_24676/m.52269 type:complete len:94 (-) Transcript_24676:219-500(-)
MYGTVPVHNAPQQVKKLVTRTKRNETKQQLLSFIKRTGRTDDDDDEYIGSGFIQNNGSSDVQSPTHPRLTRTKRSEAKPIGFTIVSYDCHYYY